jgi:condensin complex subunit 1
VSGYSASVLERSAVLALCKVMCVSKEICGENVPLIFKIMESTQVDSVIRCNIISAIGDLYQRHANVLEEYIKKLFKLLHTGRGYG